MRILGIETSCDETAAAIVEDGSKLLSNVISSQIDLHRPYGGVVPEIAARSHIEIITSVIDQALRESKSSWDDIDAIGVTKGPGLNGSLLIGSLTARTLALTKQKPLYGVDHVMGHAYANFLSETQPEFPMLALIVSGGHSQLVLFKDHFDYKLLGQTQDDAVGEAFDKVAKILGLPYPGGPSIAEAAKTGDAKKYGLPNAKLDKPYDFSFSGLKTAALRLAQKEAGVGYDFPSYELSGKLSKAQVRDIAASFQFQAIKTLVDKTKKAYEEFSPASVVIGGGVAASSELRRQLSDSLSIEITYPTPELCTDNAAMIAALAYFKARQDQPDDPLCLQINPSMAM